MPSVTVHNETVKLVAAALDRASTACFVAGVLGPAVGLMLGIGVPQDVVVEPKDFLGHQIVVVAQQPKASWHHQLVAMGCWSFLGLILHFEARRIISAMR